MKGIDGFIQNIDFISIVVSWIVCFVLGAFVKKIREQCKLIKIRRTRKKNIRKQSNKASTRNIVFLDHGDPFYKYRNINTVKTNEQFYLSIPEKQLVEIRKINSEFVSRPDTLFHAFDWEEYGSKINVPNLKALIEKHRSIVADQILTKLQNGLLVFNGEKFGVKHILIDREGVDEDARLIIRFYDTDYFTHMVTEAVFEELKEQKHDIMNTNTITDINKYYLFTSSFGVNTLILLNETKELILAKRNAYLKLSNTSSRWHVSMNEGLSLTDSEGDTIDLKQCVRRGLREELGIRTNEYESQTIFNEFGDLFIDVEALEIGITNVVKTNMSLGNLMRCYSAAKDGSLETTELITVPFSQRKIDAFLENHETTPACECCMSMLAARIDCL